MNGIATKFGEYGFVGLIVGALFFIVWRMLVWVMAFIKDQTDQHAKERQAWLEIITAMKQSLDMHDQHSLSFREAQLEANRYVRDEHKTMIEVLGNIKGCYDKK